MNKAILMGRLTRDPEVRYTSSNTVFTTFTLAVNRRFQTQDGVTADFINIISFGKTAEFCSMYFKKGQQVGIIGRIQTRNYDGQDGRKVYVTEVVAEEAYFAEGKGNSNGGNTAKPAEKPFSNNETVDFSDFNEDEFKIETEDDINL